MRHRTGKKKNLKSVEKVTAILGSFLCQTVFPTTVFARKYRELSNRREKKNKLKIQTVQWYRWLLVWWQRNLFLTGVNCEYTFCKLSKGSDYLQVDSKRNQSENETSHLIFWMIKRSKVYYVCESHKSHPLMGIVYCLCKAYGHMTLTKTGDKCKREGIFITPISETKGEYLVTIDNCYRLHVTAHAIQPENIWQNFTVQKPSSNKTALSICNNLNWCEYGKQ